MKLKYQGNARVKRAQLQRLRRTFKTLEMKVGEVCSIEESKDIDQLTVDELHASSLVHEQKVIDKRNEKQVMQVENVPRYGQGSGRGTFQRGRGYSRERGRGRSFMNRSAINCFRCGKQRHYQFKCPSLEKEAFNYAEFDEDEELLLMAYTKKSKVEREGIWFLDFGCSNHMTRDKTWFVELDESFKHTVRLGNSSKLAVEGRGSVRFEVKGITQTVTNVYCPQSHQQFSKHRVAIGEALGDLNQRRNLQNLSSTKGHEHTNNDE
ncbi:uncharacterized protein LOC111471793 [Cucurbita maxima]|uniref:Uncharacterized protein LOC111471793 n=1 Tax=Cucurbita maxima TaxID=3661 RepID=A0A6J1I6Z2_CUCMA|nr:uncharacterized protein LOC111471793 [Cucurbita maxima]